jgi:hypothetical protein
MPYFRHVRMRAISNTEIPAVTRDAGGITGSALPRRTWGEMLKTRGLRSGRSAAGGIFDAFGVAAFGAKSASATSRARVIRWRSSLPARRWCRCASSKGIGSGSVASRKHQHWSRGLSSAMTRKWGSLLGQQEPEESAQSPYDRCGAYFPQLPAIFG